MPKCHFCDHNNPVGIDRCQNCGAWVEQKAGSTSKEQAEPSPEPDSLEAKVLALMEGGKKIQAIKLYRQQTGCDLKNAKDAVEALAAKHGIVSKGGGCAGVVLVMLVAVGIVLVGIAALRFAGVAAADAPPADQEQRIALEIARLGSPSKSESAAAIKALIQMGKPAAPALLKSLSDPNSDVRALAVEALRSILAADPNNAPNYHEKAYWEERVAQLKAGMPLDEALKFLLPGLSPADRQKRCEGADWSGQSGTSRYRLDDYWLVHLYLVDFDHKKLHDHLPDLFRSVRKVWVAPLPDYTGVWVAWYVNGQKAHEIQYRNGKYDGTFTTFYDDGPKCVRQHYTMGVCQGTDSRRPLSKRTNRCDQCDECRRLGGDCARTG